MRQFIIDLSIGAEKMLSYYQGNTQQVLAEDVQGLRVSFPAQALRPFVTRDGVHGRFCIRIDDNNKLIDVSKL